MGLNPRQSHKNLMQERFNRLIHTSIYVDPVEYRMARNVAILAALMPIVAIIFSITALAFSDQSEMVLTLIAITALLLLAAGLAFWLLRNHYLEYAGIPSLLVAFIAASLLFFQHKLTGQDRVELRYEYGVLWICIVLATMISTRRVVILSGVVSLVLMFFVQRSVYPYDEIFGFNSYIEIAALTLFVTCLAWLISHDLEDITHQITSRSELRRLQLVETSQAVLSRISSRQDTEALLSEVVEMIRQQFEEVYYAQVFLLNDDSTRAVLRASTGEVGKQLLAKGHQLPLESKNIIGRAIEQGEAVLISDTTHDLLFKYDELLPNTRTQLVLPLRTKEGVIGVLDIQSLNPHIFSAKDVEAFQTLADQIAVVIENARLFNESERTARENLRLLQGEKENRQIIEQLHQEMSRQAWRDYLSTVQTPRHSSIDMLTGEQKILRAESPQAVQASRTGQVVIETLNEVQRVAIPIVVRGLAIGVIEFELKPDEPVPLPIQEALTTLGERVGMIAENARLFETVQHAAAHQEQLNQVTTSLQGITDIELLLETAVSELGKAIGAGQGYIRLATPKAESGHEDLNAQEAWLEV